MVLYNYHWADGILLLTRAKLSSCPCDPERHQFLFGAPLETHSQCDTLFEACFFTFCFVLHVNINKILQWTDLLDHFMLFKQRFNQVQLYIHTWWRHIQVWEGQDGSISHFSGEDGKKKCDVLIIFRTLWDGLNRWVPFQFNLKLVDRRLSILIDKVTYIGPALIELVLMF